MITWLDRQFYFKDKESIVLPPRTNLGFVVRVSIPEIKTGHLPRQRYCDVVYCGDSLVTCINNKAYIRIVNTLDHEVEVIIPTVTLNEIEKITAKPPCSDISTKQFQVNNTKSAEFTKLSSNFNLNYKIFRLCKQKKIKSQ